MNTNPTKIEHVFQLAESLANRLGVPGPSQAMNGSEFRPGALAVIRHSFEEQEGYALVQITSSQGSYRFMFGPETCTAKRLGQMIHTAIMYHDTLHRMEKLA